MIILFHFLSTLIYQLLQNRKRVKDTQNQKLLLEMNSHLNVDLEYNIKFDPPVYLQRYEMVYLTLLDERWRTTVNSLVDFGCAELSLFRFLKSLNCLHNIFFVDIDEFTLDYYYTKLFPIPVDYLNRRKEPLQICVLKGSVSDPDCRLHNVDVVTAIELIEHLYPDVLEAFPYNVFHYIKPKLVLITTPNYDFNVLFSNSTNKFRHYDHKFEWSREQFENWANNIVERFPDYVVSFSGLGRGPKGTEQLGQCTQTALFVRKDLVEDTYISESNDSSCLCDSSSPCKITNSQSSKFLCNCVCVHCQPRASYGICTYCSRSEKGNPPEHNTEQNGDFYYKVIATIDYPVDDDKRTEEERMRDEIIYKLNHSGSLFFVDERSRIEMPLVDLLYGSNVLNITESELKRLLIKLGYKVEECRMRQTGLVQTCVLYEPVMEEISSTSDASGWDSDPTKYELNEESLSDWDDPCSTRESKKPSGSCEDHQNGFPGWLLQILGTQVAGEGDDPLGPQDEPHFYCQGDGLGVHPSVIAVEIDEEETTTDSSNNTIDYAELDHPPSSHDMNSLPEDAPGNVSNSQEESADLATTVDENVQESNSTADVGTSGT